jgi:hypothetical protein
MDIKRVAVYYPGKNTAFTKYVPAYEVPILREQLKKRGDTRSMDQFKVSDAPDNQVLMTAHMGNEYRRLSMHYRKYMRLAYPTEASFEEAFEECVKLYGVRDTGTDVGQIGEERESLEVEQLKGIGPTLADDLASIGAATFAGLAEANAFEIAGIDGISLSKAKQYIAEARERVGLKDEDELVEDADSDTLE